MTCSDEHSIGLREHLIELVGKEMQNPDNKDFYREDLVNDLNLENNETTATPGVTTPKPKPEGKTKPKKPKPEPEAKKDAKAAKAKATRAALLKKLAGLQGKGAPKEAQEEEEEEDENEDEESEEDPPEIE